MKNERGELSQTWEYKDKKMDNVWLGIDFWEEEDYIRVRVNKGKLGWVDGLVVGEHEPVTLTGGYYDQVGEGFLAVLINDSLVGVHKSKLRYNIGNGREENNQDL